MANSVPPSLFPTSTSTTGNSALSQAVDNGSASNTASSQLVNNFDTFLQLLVTQIQNQDPTDPVETESFTNQLTQFSELEQQIQSNSSLESILNTIQSQNAASVVSYIGSTVTADGATTTLANGQATYSLSVSETVPNAQIQILDRTGSVVFEGTQALNRGDNLFVFNAESVTNRQLRDGDAFTIVASGENEDGDFVNISSAISGVVDGVDFSNSVPSLRIGPTNIPLSAVTSVNTNNNS